MTTHGVLVPVIEAIEELDNRQSGLEAWLANRTQETVNVSAGLV